MTCTEMFDKYAREHNLAFTKESRQEAIDLLELAQWEVIRMPIPLKLLEELLQVLHQNFYNFVYENDKVMDITYKLEEIIKKEWPK